MTSAIWASLQWAYDLGRFDAGVKALAAGPVKEMTWHRDSFGGVPQLFVSLDEPGPVVRDQVQDLVSGALVGRCMTKAISAQNGLAGDSTPVRGRAAPA
jgi:hypothetical protein